jgi:Fe-S-cluster containining protein
MSDITIEDARQRVVADIGEVGAMTRETARRYERVFSGFRAELDAVLNQTGSMTEAALAAMAMVEAAASAVRGSFPNQPRLGCRDGCASCCHLFVAIPPGVSTAIAEHIRATFDIEQQEALIARLSAAAEALAAVENPLWARVRCPLLDDADRCTIYSVRPLTCRAFTSRSEAACRTFIFDTDPASEGGIDQNPAHYRMHVEATQALVDAARNRGLPHGQTGFVAALLAELCPPAN